MKPRASRIADIVASVPDETSRTWSTGVRADDLLAELDLRQRRGPERRTGRDGALDGVDDLRVGVAEDHRAPGADQVDVVVAVDVGEVGALPLAMNRGVPPTARKARTGLLTPPGVTSSARAKRSPEPAVCIQVARAVEGSHRTIVTDNPERSVPGAGGQSSRAHPTVRRDITVCTDSSPERIER